MSDTALRQLEVLRKRNADRTWVNRDLYRLLYKPDLYEVVYEQIRSNPGNMTAGTDGTTLDGFSLKTIARLIESIKDESFQFKPAKRVYIPKPNGKMRPLGMPPPLDKIVQGAISMVLEAIYDSPYGAFFNTHSHGFRPGRSCHTALREFGEKWTGVPWIVEGDIKACFDDIDHHILVAQLRRKIDDERFIGLIWKALRAGYLWMGERVNSLTGTPQGSGVSPILANIYLHALDEFIAKLKEKHEIGTRRCWNPEYRRLQGRRKYALNVYDGTDASNAAIIALAKQMRQLPSQDTHDPNYVRIQYIRYADDWILGVIGPRSLAVQFKDEIKVFLREQLKLTLSPEKTLITHAATEKANFLGYRVKLGRRKPGAALMKTIRKTGKRVFKQRVTGQWPLRLAPMDKLVAKLHNKGFCDKLGFPSSKTAWTVLDADQIIRLFNSNLWGLLNYYRFVDNFSAMSRIQYILRFSLAKTLAHKFRTSMAKLFRKHGKNLCFRWMLPTGKLREVSFEENTDWTIKRDTYMERPPNIDLLRWQTALRSRSKMGFPCLICGCEENVQMHHVRHIRKMGAKPPTGFTAVMRALNRKQVPVCRPCHEKIHRGEYDGIRLQELAYDFFALPT
jgi:group II intron reverse transcriptase/maturase